MNTIDFSNVTECKQGMIKTNWGTVYYLQEVTQGPKYVLEKQVLTDNFRVSQIYPDFSTFISFIKRLYECA